jgi:RNA polymerase sigma-70 factor (ECF subfamily)
MADELDRQAARNFESLLTEYQRRLYFFIRSMVFDPEDARDVLQDVNVIAFRKREQFVPGTDFKAWLFAIARFEGLTYLSRRKKVHWSNLDSDVLETLANKAEERSDDVEPYLGALAKCREALPQEAAELLTLRYQHRVMLETVAERWKTSVGALKQKLFRIRTLLKDCIHQRLGSGEISGDDTGTL